MEWWWRVREDHEPDTIIICGLCMRTYWTLRPGHQLTLVARLDHLTGTVQVCGICHEEKVLDQTE
ncbi:MAG: hypothetical protein C5B54_04285 [Acidobacteria bacterium]|nr:MAG: hypothetical protein C5B54_04285 [Acidobacteriota bacterium]